MHYSQNALVALSTRTVDPPVAEWAVVFADHIMHEAWATLFGHPEITQTLLFLGAVPT